jgi:hypothetical protein
MSALNVLKVTPPCSTRTMFVMFSDELRVFQGFEIICNTLAGLWYGQEDVIYPALLIRIGCCTVKFCAVDILPVVQADRNPPEPHWTECHESQLGCTGNDPYHCTKPQHSSGYR